MLYLSPGARPPSHFFRAFSAVVLQCYALSLFDIACRFHGLDRATRVSWTSGVPRTTRGTGISRIYWIFRLHWGDWCLWTAGVHWKFWSNWSHWIARWNADNIAVISRYTTVTCASIRHCGLAGCWDKIGFYHAVCLAVFAF